MKKMILPPVHNTRAPEQWAIISRHVDFNGRSVLDLGCGYGDILLRCHQAGAGCRGIDKDSYLVERQETRLLIGASGFYFRLMDFAARLYELPQRNDIVICFAVLPYLTNQDEVLHWIHWHSRLAFIECQYHGDGPGMQWLRDDNDMRRWLEEIGWQKIAAIGRTEVKGRGVWRTIWKCED